MTETQATQYVYRNYAANPETGEGSRDGWRMEAFSPPDRGHYNGNRNMVRERPTQCPQMKPGPRPPSAPLLQVREDYVQTELKPGGHHCSRRVGGKCVSCGAMRWFSVREWNGKGRGCGMCREKRKREARRGANTGS